MRKEILSSIIITVLILMGVYFVVSSGIEAGNGKNTFYNITTASGVTEKGANPWWNPYTNYSGNTSQIVSGNSNPIFFNFTINNSLSASGFTGNITNITINFTNYLFQLDVNSVKGNLSGCVGKEGGMKNTNLGTTQITFYNDSLGGLTNGSGETGAAGFSNCTYQINVTVNGTGNTNTNAAGLITVNVSNASNTGSNRLTFNVAVDSAAPTITNIQVSNGLVTQNIVTSGSVYLSNASNITIYATITDANIWWNNTADRTTGPNRFGNITIWWNATGSGAVKRNIAGIFNATNMTNLSSCTWAEGANGCVFYATLPKLGNQQQEGGNMSFVITASDYFNHNTNASVAGGIVGYNITFDNTAASCEITVSDERSIVFRGTTVSCTGDINETRLYESQSGVEICKDWNSCTGTYTPEKSGTRTLQCETKDNAGNVQSCSLDVVVYSRESIYASEGTAGGVVAPAPLDITQAPGTTGLSTGQSTTFKYGTIDHIIKIDSITLNSVTVSVDSVSATIPSGGSKEFDLTGDGTNDIKVTLNKVLLNKADISVEKLAGATVEAPKEVVQEQPKSLTWVWVVLILVVLAVIIYLVISAKKNK